MKKDNTLLIAIIGAAGAIIAAFITLLQPYVAHTLDNNTSLGDDDKNEIIIPRERNKTKDLELKPFNILSLGLSKAKDLPNNLYIRINNIYIKEDKIFVLSKIFQGDMLIPKIDETVIISAEILFNNNLTSIVSEQTYFYLKEIKNNGEIIITNFKKELTIKFYMKFYDKGLDSKYSNQDIFNSINLQVLLHAFKFYIKINKKAR